MLLMSSAHLDENFSSKPSNVEIDLSWMFGLTCAPIFLKLNINQRFLLWKFYHARNRLEYQCLLKEILKERGKMQAKLSEAGSLLSFRPVSCLL